MTPHEAVAAAIIEAQRALMGHVAIKLAEKVPSISFDDAGTPSINGDGVSAVDALVREYSSITGPLGVRMCFNAAKPVLDQHADVKIPSFTSLS